MNQILFSECKWQDNVNSQKIFEQLKEKTEHVNWNNDNRQENYVIFAKSFSKRTKQALCIDLKDIEKISEREEEHHDRKSE
jgi:hypothetical protein